MNYTEENAKLEKEIEYLELCIDTMYGPDVRRCWWGGRKSILAEIRVS